MRGPGRPPIDRRELEPVLEAVLRLAARGGSRSVTFREIASEAGVSVGRLQHHFGTRDELISAAVEWHLLQVTERLDALGRQPGTATERVGRMIDEIVDRSWQRSSIWIDLLGRSSDSATYRTAAREVNDAWYHVLVRIIRDGAEAGEFVLRASVEDTARNLVCASDGLAVLVVQDGPAENEARAPWRRHLFAMTVGALLGITV